MKKLYSSKSKPISSPGRAEKYPPPLMMRFLRSNVGSRSSRGRSRASPMFVLRKKTKNEIEAQQEPSSPKVTCMGQVRVRRGSSKQQQPTAGGGLRRTPTAKRRWRRRRCMWTRKLWKNIQPGSIKSTFRKWVDFFRCGCGSKSEIGADSSRFGSKIGGIQIEQTLNHNNGKLEDEELEAKTLNFISNFSSPPKNALSLMRCRSAPYRSSSLACRFWGSPLNNEEQKQSKTEENQIDEEEDDNATSGRESTCRNSDPETVERLGCLDRSNSIKTDKIEELPSKTEESEPPSTLRLTRCKSEPARTGVKLDPELIYSRKRRWVSPELIKLNQCPF